MCVERELTQLVASWCAQLANLLWVRHVLRVIRKLPSRGCRNLLGSPPIYCWTSTIELPFINEKSTIILQSTMNVMVLRTPVFAIQEHTCMQKSDTHACFYGLQQRAISCFKGLGRISLGQ